MQERRKKDCQNRRKHPNSSRISPQLKGFSPQRAQRSRRNSRLAEQLGSTRRGGRIVGEQGHEGMEEKSEKSTAEGGGITPDAEGPDEAPPVRRETLLGGDDGS